MIQNRVVQLRNYVIIWVRFIDDIFLIWKGDIDSLTEFIDHPVNNAAPSIKFTHEICTNSVNFLDTTVLKDRQGNISTDVYQKPTDTHPYLHWTSAHPTHQTKYPVQPSIEIEKNMLFH